MEVVWTADITVKLFKTTTTKPFFHFLIIILQNNFRHPCLAIHSHPYVDIHNIIMYISIECSISQHNPPIYIYYPFPDQVYITHSFSLFLTLPLPLSVSPSLSHTHTHTFSVRQTQPTDSRDGYHSVNIEPVTILHPEAARAESIIRNAWGTSKLVAD